MTAKKEVLIIGGGVAGLSAALGLSQVGIRSVLVEKQVCLGGYAAQYACKATSACVKCGACMVMEKISRTVEDPNIDVLTGSRIDQISRTEGFETVITQETSDGRTRHQTRETGAVILACGFKPFDPENKPYGYKRFANVVTNLDLERMLREKSVPLRPSDGAAPARMAFVQCVGSRDAQLGHLWCSKICCASALRMARLIKMRRPATEITFFYIDVQTFGQEFQRFYDDVREEVHMIRAIPGDVYRTPERSPDSCLLRFQTPSRAVKSRSTCWCFQSASPRRQMRATWRPRSICRPHPPVSFRSRQTADTRKRRVFLPPERCADR